MQVMPSPTRKCFGTFDVDLEAGELRRNGLKLKLQEKPFQMLAMLLERPGEVVTRDALRERLWAADTFVDFDHGLNTATRKLRQALGDSAENPRFIETLARRGYRFIAPVASVELPEPLLRSTHGRIPLTRRRQTCPQGPRVSRRSPRVVLRSCAAVALRCLALLPSFSPPSSR